MLNTVYRLTAPRTIEPVVVSQDTTDKVIVRPTYLSICNADQRYYQGTRSKEVLAKKLPMALIHEGIGRVVSDSTGAFQSGDIVVMLPNAPIEQDEFIAENYLRSSRFCGSGFDGFMQESTILPPERVVLLPQDVNCEVAAFTELVSVATHAISRFDKIAHGRRDRIGVWGDGNMGYIVSLLLHKRYPDAKVVVFGRNESKLHDFTFADETHLVDDVSGVGLVDHAFECAGGEGSVAAIEQIIDRINPEGTVSLLGVSENNVPINTRMVLRKGLGACLQQPQRPRGLRSHGAALPRASRGSGLPRRPRLQRERGAANIGYFGGLRDGHPQAHGQDGHPLEYVGSSK